MISSYTHSRIITTIKIYIVFIVVRLGTLLRSDLPAAAPFRQTRRGTRNSCLYPIGIRMLWVAGRSSPPLLVHAFAMRKAAPRIVLVVVVNCVDLFGCDAVLCVFVWSHQRLYLFALNSHYLCILLEAVFCCVFVFHFLYTNYKIIIISKHSHWD